MHGIKGVSAHKINFHRNTRGRIWQKESYDRIVRDEKEFDMKLNYMYNNPIKKGLTKDSWLYWLVILREDIDKTSIPGCST